MSKITHALPAFADQLTEDDRNRINAISRNALRRGVTHYIEEIVDFNRNLFFQDYPPWSLFRTMPLFTRC